MFETLFSVLPVQVRAKVERLVYRYTIEDDNAIVNCVLANGFFRKEK